MEKFLTRLKELGARLPGPGQVIVGGLLADRQALRILLACLAAVLAAALQPPVLSLSVAHVQQGLRDPGSIVPLQITAAYLLLAVLTLVGGASGDLFGRKRYLLFGLFGVLATNVLGLFWFDAPQYSAINALNLISSTVVMPMTVAIVTVAFPLTVRPFAYGALFACQGLGLVASSSLYGIFALTDFVGVSFVPAIILGVIAIRYILAMMLVTLFIVRLSAHFDARRIIAGGLALMAVGLTGCISFRSRRPISGSSRRFL